MTYNADIFHNLDKKIKYRRKVNHGKAALSCKYGGFPELNAALRHILILYSFFVEGTSFMLNNLQSDVILPPSPPLYCLDTIEYRKTSYCSVPNFDT